MAKKQKLLVLTGAGVSAESGLKTFRDAGGLWEGYEVTEVATPEAWERDPQLVLRFYNERRKALLEAEPNAGHKALVNLESKYDVTIVTQNVDDLHERAGSSHVLHLHGELLKSRSTADPELVYPVEGWELAWGDVCERGSQLRPNIVWFGEAVPMMEMAIEYARQAEIFMVIGTSLAVYPAAGLIGFVETQVPKYMIDPKAPSMLHIPNLEVLRMKAGEGVPELAKRLLEQ